jgi:hypothetical protein
VKHVNKNVTDEVIKFLSKGGKRSVVDLGSFSQLIPLPRVKIFSYIVTHSVNLPYPKGLISAG